MGMKSFFQKVFNITPNSNQASRGFQAQFLNGSPQEFSPYTGELYANSLARAIVHKIANYCSMVTFEHVRGSGSSFQKVNSHLNTVLSLKPNSLGMTPSEVWYKFFTDLWITNNAYLWLKRDDLGVIREIFPIVTDKVDMVEISGYLFYRFTFDKGDKVVLPIEDVVHRRRFFYKNDWFGSDNDPLRQSLGYVDAMNVSIDASLKNSAQIKGILKHQNTINPEDLEAHVNLFRNTYLSPTNSGGIGAIDAKFDFVPIAYSGKITDAEQMKEIRDYVYRYFQINDKIMMSDYTSDIWQSFHEGAIAPELNGLQQSLSIHAFTDKELGYKNRIASSIDNISFMSNQQKISMVKLALDGALYSRNEIREWFGDAPIPGGDTYQFSKNFTADSEDNPENLPKEETDGKAVETDSPDAV